MKLTLSVLFTAAALVSTAAPTPKPVSPEMLQRIADAMPATAPARPAAPRRLLVFFLASGFKHDSIGTANQCLEIMGRKTGAFTADFSDDMAVFTAENLAKYDGVLFNNTTTLAFDNAAAREALMAFVKGGKGVAGIHAATDSFYGWPEAAGMIGGLFDGHPWHAGGTWRIRVTDPAHICNESFKGEETFLLKDEIYQLKSPYNRNDRRLLLELDAFAPENKNVNGKKREDDFGIAWIKPFEKGRVFYCSLGHNHEIFWNPKVLAHYLAGIQYALGDLKAPDTPIPLAEAPGVSALRTWTSGAPNDAIMALEARIPGLEDAGLRAMEASLAAVAADSAATADGRDEALRMLARCGSGASVPAVAALLGDARLGSRAFWALTRNLSPEATQALRDALAGGPDAVKVEAATSLGSRRDAESVPALAGLGASSGAPARAALEALGRIGAPALDALAALKVSAELQPALENALLRAAESEGGARAAAVLKSLQASSSSVNVRAACVTLLGRAGDAGAVTAALSSPDVRVWQAAVGAVRLLQGGEAAAAIGKALPGVPAGRLPALIQSIANSGNAGAAASLVPLFGSSDVAVRDAALDTVARLDVGAHLSSLLSLAAKADDTGKAALKALMETPLDVATPLLALIPGLAAAEQEVALSPLATRGDRQALPALLKSALDPSDDKIGRIAADAVARMGGQGDYAALVKAITANAGLRGRLVPALRIFGPRAPDAEAAAASLGEALDAGLPVKETCMLLGSLKSEGAATRLIKLASSSDAEIARTALRELGSMSSPTVVRRLAALSKESGDATVRSLALRAAARAVPGAELPEDEKIQVLDALYSAAASADDRKAVLSGASAFVHPGILGMVRKASADPELKAEVEGIQKALQAAGWPVVSVTGEAVFPAKTAVIRGGNASYEPGAARDCVGNWSAADTWVFWVASSPAAGKYKVSIEHSCQGVAGADVDFVVAGTVLPFKVVETGGWDKFPETVLGEADLPAGIASVEVRPRNKPAPFVMNLRTVKLTPVK